MKVYHYIVLIFLFTACKSNQRVIPKEQSIINFHHSGDPDYSAAFHRAIDSKYIIIHIPKGIYNIGKTISDRGCLFAFYGDNPRHSNKTFLFEEGAILKIAPSIPNKKKFNRNCNLFILENGRTRSLTNIRFENLTIDFSENVYSNSIDITEHLVGVKIVTSKFRNRKSFNKNPIVKDVEFINTKFINGGSFTIYGGTNIIVDGLEMINPKIGLTVATDEHFNLYEPNMHIKNVRVIFSEDYINNLNPKIADQIYGFDFSELPPKRTKTYTAYLDSIYVENATFCKVQGYGNLNLNNIHINGGRQGGQACFKINDANHVKINNLNIENRTHKDGNSIIDIWHAKYVSLENVTIKNCDLIQRSGLVKFHKEAKSVIAKNIFFENNKSKYSIISESPNLEVENTNNPKIKLYKSAIINNQHISSGEYKIFK